MAGLQYLGGYIFRNLHQKIRGSSKWKTISCQQSLSILEAAKLDEVSRSQDLVSCLNRGGLWSICTAAENVFVKSRSLFQASSGPAEFFNKNNHQRDCGSEMPQWCRHCIKLPKYCWQFWIAGRQTECQRHASCYHKLIYQNKNLLFHQRHCSVI